MNGIERMAAAYTEHSVPPDQDPPPFGPPDPAAGACGDCLDCPVCVRLVAKQGCCCDRPRFELPEEFLFSKRGAQVGNVLETEGAAAAAPGAERRTTC